MSLLIIGSGEITESKSLPKYLGDSHSHKTPHSSFGYSLTDKYSVVQGTWVFRAQENQTNYDPELISSAGTIYNSSLADLDEIKWTNILLTTGIYVFTIVFTEHVFCGIAELLHGATSIGTFDCAEYADTSFNKVVTFFYVVGTPTLADLRLRVNGKTGITYEINFSELKIARVNTEYPLSSVFRTIVFGTPGGLKTLKEHDGTVLVDCTGGAITTTLPTAVNIPGKVYNIKKIDSTVNAVTIDGNGAETIDGAATQVISFQYDSLTIQSDGANWYII